MKNISLACLLSVLLLTQSTFAGRYYDSATGRWLSIDPKANKYPGWSPYNYCLNNPLRNIDPDGKDVRLYYRKPNNDAGHIILQVVDHLTGKVKATWSFGPKNSTSALSLSNVEGHQTENISVYLKENASRLVESTISTDQQTDNRVTAAIEQRIGENEEYNVLSNNCGQTAAEIIQSSANIPMSTESVLPSSVFDDFLKAKADYEKKKAEEKKKKEEEKKENENK